MARRQKWPTQCQPCPEADILSQSSAETRPPPPIPLFLPGQNLLSPKDIAGSDIIRLHDAYRYTSSNEGLVVIVLGVRARQSLSAW